MLRCGFSRQQPIWLSLQPRSRGRLLDPVSPGHLIMTWCVFSWSTRGSPQPDSLSDVGTWRKPDFSSGASSAGPRTRRRWDVDVAEETLASQVAHFATFLAASEP
jgi:hypothetical protein